MLRHIARAIGAMNVRTNPRASCEELTQRRAQHTQASRMHNEEKMLMRSATETLPLTWHQPESAREA